MATYAIGDVHGCFQQLQHLLEIIDFNPKKDTLWFTGDYVNGGPEPLATLRFIKSLGDNTICILGNHDVHLLAVAAGLVPKLNDRKIGVDEVLAAPDLNEITAWLRTRPFAHYEPAFNALIVHAGVLPSWSLPEIMAHAETMSKVLQSPEADTMLSMVIGNEPDTWDHNLDGWPRIKFFLNCFTRMRFCNEYGKLDLTSKGDLNDIPEGFLPWFQLPRQNKYLKIIFGHWASLLGKTGVANALAIDTGCVWGNTLTALRLNDWKRFEVSSTLVETF